MKPWLTEVLNCCGLAVCLVVLVSLVVWCVPLIVWQMVGVTKRKGMA